ncbi:MAG TPA: hypothetical protein VN598_08235 [Usitatibacter sp.]|nr:hypothetical protein [Usitatibacter sp.]
MKAAHALGAAAAIFATAALAEDAPAPPPSPAEARMQELHQVINDPKSTAARRKGAREELANLLRSPAGQGPIPAPGEKPARAPRAAVEPLAPLVKPAANPAISTPPVAHVDVTQPARTLVTPTGKATAPAGNDTAIDPRNGHVLTQTPNGYIDPRTGQFTPR